MSRLPDKPQQFSIATLLLVTTLIAVCLAILRAVPLIGTMVLFVIIPAYVRTALLVMRSNRHGERVAAAEKVLVFFESLFVAVAAVAAAVFTLFATAIIGIGVTGLLRGTPSVALPIGMGAVVSSLAAAVIVFRWILKATWPSQGDFASLIHPDRSPSAPRSNPDLPHHEHST